MHCSKGAAPRFSKNAATGKLDHADSTGIALKFKFKHKSLEFEYIHYQAERRARIISAQRLSPLSKSGLGHLIGTFLQLLPGAIDYVIDTLKSRSDTSGEVQKELAAMRTAASKLSVGYLMQSLHQLELADTALELEFFARINFGGTHRLGVRLLHVSGSDIDGKSVHLKTKLKIGSELVGHDF